MCLVSACASREDYVAALVRLHALLKPGGKIVLYTPHCKIKLVVLTPEWLPWLQTNWRDSGYESFTVVLKSNCIRQPKMPLSSFSYNHNTLTTLRTSVNESLQLHFKVAVYCNFEVQL